MQDRHLLPNEIDLLLDGEAGFGVSPLRAHVEQCAECRSRLGDARAIVDALERLPRLAPSVRFSDQVLKRVQIVEPVHVAVFEMARRLLPKSAPMRLVMAASAAVLASSISATAVWVGLHADAALYATNLVLDRTRTSLLNGAGSLIGSTLGTAGLDAARLGGVTGLAIGASLIFAAVGGATFGFRALATASRRSRE